MQWTWVPYACVLYLPYAFIRMRLLTLYLLQLVLLAYMTFEHARTGLSVDGFIAVTGLQFTITFIVFIVKRVLYDLDLQYC